MSQRSVNFERNEHELQIPERVKYFNQAQLRITDFDLQTIPRAIYSDFITEMQHREEGYSGSMKPKPIINQQPIKFHSVQDQLTFLSRVPVIATEEEPESNVSMSEASLDGNEQIETRTVVLTDWGIDILNFQIKNPILPLEKPKMTSPLEKMVYHNKPREVQRDYQINVRYGSWLNHANSTTKQYRDQANKNCIQMNKSMLDSAKKNSLRYKRPFVARPSTLLVRGLSFRGRGNLDLRMGWANPSDFESNYFGGDIVDVVYKNDEEPVSLVKDLDKVTQQPVGLRPSLKHISSTLSSTEVTLKPVMKPVPESRPSALSAIQRTSTASSAPTTREAEVVQESIVSKRESIITSVKEEEKELATPPAQKRSSLLKSFQDESRNILQTTGLNAANNVEVKRKTSKRESVSSTTDESKRNSTATEQLPTVIDAMVKRYSLLADKESKVEEESPLNENADDDWIAQEKKNLFGNWRSEIPQKTELEAAVEVVEKGASRENSINNRKKSNSVSNKAAKLGSVQKEKEPVILEKKEEKPLSRLEMMIKKQQDAAASEKALVTTEKKEESTALLEKQAESILQTFVQPNTTEATHVTIQVVSSVQQSTNSAPISRFERMLLQQQESAKADPERIKDSPLSLTQTPTSASQKASSPESNSPSTNSSEKQASSLESRNVSESVLQSKDSLSSEPTSVLVKTESSSEMKRLQSTESLKQDIQEQKSEKGSFFKRIMSTESLKFGVKKSGSKSSLLDPPTSESNNDHSIEKEKSRFGLRKSGSKSSLVDSPASQSNNDSPVEQKSKFKFGVKKSGSRSSLLDLPASQPVEEKKSIVQESQEVGPSETSELANSIAVSADELKPVVKPTEIKVDSIPKKPLSRLEALLNADSVEEKKSGVSYEYKEVVQSKEQVQTVPPPIPSTHTKPVSQKAVSPVHQTFERKDQDHSPIKEKKIEVVNEAPSVPIVQDVVKESNPEESPVTNSHKVGPKTGRFLNAMDMASIENKSVLKPSESKVEPVNPQKEETPEKVEVEKVAVLPAKPAEQEIKTPEPAKAEVHKETPEKYLAKPQTVTWKDHKVELKVIDFELHANETGKSKPYKEYLPIHLRRVIGLEIEKGNTVIIHCCITRGKDKDGSDLKKIAVTFNDASQARIWKETMIEMNFGGFYEQSLKLQVLFLLEKSDKDSIKLVEKHMVEVLEQAKKPHKIEIVQYNEFSVGNILEKYDFKKLSNVVCTNESFLPRIQQVMVRNQLCMNPVSLSCESDPIDAAVDILRSCIGRTKITTVHVSAINLKRKEEKLLGMFKKK